MTTYSNPAVQAAAEGIRANIVKADSIIASTKQTVELGKRRDDTLTGGITCQPSKT